MTTTEWTEQDHAHLTHLAEADEPTWMGEVASRALKYIEHLYVENQSLRDSARQHDMREELAHALGVDASEAPASLLSRVHELAESIRADTTVFEELDSLRPSLTAKDEEIGKLREGVALFVGEWIIKDHDGAWASVGDGWDDGGIVAAIVHAREFRRMRKAMYPQRGASDELADDVLREIVDPPTARLGRSPEKTNNG